MTAGSRAEVSGRGPGTGRGRSAEAAYREARVRLLELGGARAEERVEVVGDGVVAYLEAGAGRPLVLVQGGTGGGANWFRVLGALAGRRRVLAVDLPGFGRSSPVVPRAPVGGQAAEVVLGWLDQVGVDRFDLMGTSLGGLVGLRLAQRCPDRVRRLVLLSSAGLGRAMPWPVHLATLPGVGPLLMRPSRSGTDWVLRRYLTTNRAGMPGEVQEALVAYLHASERMGDARFLWRALRAFGGLGGQREVVGPDELAALELPVLVCWGDADRFFPLRHARRAARALAAGRLEVIRGAGHSPNWETPDAFLERVLPFLEG